MFDETKLPAAAAEATIGALQELAKQGGVNAGRPHGEAAKVGEALVQTAAAVAPVAVCQGQRRNGRCDGGWFRRSRCGLRHSLWLLLLATGSIASSAGSAASDD